MESEKRTVYFDNTLQIEAYRLDGILQRFPNHFHEYNVIGFIEKGRRHLSCKNAEYTINAGDLLLFNPMENHACEQLDEKTMDYRSLNISSDVMKRVIAEITGKGSLPHFVQTVIPRSESVSLLKELHQMIMDEYTGLEKEETFYFLIEQLTYLFAGAIPEKAQEVSPEIQKVCHYIENHFSEVITLDALSKLSGINKYTLLRNFTKQRGITPYRYLETIRVNAAKKMIECGSEPIDAAIEAGFTDQSHFTKFFKNYIGLTPRQYRNIFREADSK